MAVEAATHRVRALEMIVGMNIVGLIPIMISESARADVAKRIASPMQGGLGSLTALTLFPSLAPYVLRRMLRVRRAVQADLVGAEGPS